MAKIKQVYAREILNSKAMPTVEATVLLDNGMFGTASCPTGTSVGAHEAVEIRDNDPARFNGEGVVKVISNILSEIAPKIIGMEVTSQREIDKAMIELDGTKDKSRLGANALLPVSIACLKAGAKSVNMPLFAYIRQFTSIGNKPYRIPTPAFNILNGGKHAGNNLDFQEFMVIPATSMSYPQSLNLAVSIYNSLKKNLQDKGANTLVGDEGGFGPSFATNRDALIMVSEAISSSNFRIGYDVFLGMDIAANNFFEGGKYKIKDKDSSISSKELVTVYGALNDEFNLLYLEDPLAENDWDGWKELNDLTSKDTLIVGDDLTCTNLERLQMAIEKKAIGAMIVKPNQIGTILETLAVVEVARNAGLKLIASHRSGDTTDDFIADFSVGIGSDYVKFGAPARGERVAKYNRLLEIDSMLRSS